MVSPRAIAPEMQSYCNKQRSRVATGKTLRDVTNGDLHRLLPLQQKRCLRAIGTGTNELRATGVAWHGDSKHLVTLNQSGAVILWDTVTATARQFARRPLACSVAVAPSTDVEETVVALGGMDNAISLCNLSPALGKGEMLERLPSLGTSHEALITALAFGGKETLYTAGGDGDLRVWSVAKGQTTQVLRGHGKDVVGLAVSKDVLAGSPATASPSSLASVSLDGTVRLWDLRANCETHVFDYCPDKARLAEADTAAVSLFPSGYAVAAGGVDGVVRLFDTRAYATLAELTAGNKPAAPITGIQCSLSGRAIYTSHSGDASLGVWEPFGETQGRVHKHVAFKGVDYQKMTVVGLSLSPEGNALAAAGYDSTVRIFGSKPTKA